MDRILFIGGDKRIFYAYNATEAFCRADLIGFDSYNDKLEGQFDAIVLPLPVSRDGVHIFAPTSEAAIDFGIITEYAAKGATVFGGGRNEAVEQLCRENDLNYVNYLAYEPLTLKNAALTAEAAAALLIQSTDGSLFGANVIVTGGGRVAEYTAKLLKAFGADVTICARSAEQRARAELSGVSAAGIEKLSELCRKADFVINTVPAELFSEEQFSVMKRGAVFLELATLPPKTLSERYGVQYIHGGGLPGKFSPRTAGKLIAEAVQRLSLSRAI
jgi:dipicolinate synthase subunit A